MALINVFIIFSLLALLHLFLGIINIINDKQESTCEMTYMFEYPQFVQIEVSSNIDRLHERYSLYAYSEGRLTENARNMIFDGIPVLFIPGNKGSHKQVRSFASIALRKSVNSRSGFHFDFFTVDLNDELSALNGAVLYQQAKYVERCIEKVLELYNGSYKPTSVILMGHSMGGTIAEYILTSLPNNSSKIPLVITLATFHMRPPVNIDSYMNDFYNTIKKGAYLFHNATLISVAGGFNDLLVSPHLTKPLRNNSLHVVSTHIPKAWLTMDHLCILWCKQLVLAITRALFECVDVRTKQLIQNPDDRLSVFKHHLVHNNGIKVHLRDRYNYPVNMRATNDEWIEKLSRQYTIHLPHGTNHIQWHMIRLLDQPKHEYLTLVAINLEVTNWVFVCPAIFLKGQSRVCEEGIHLSHLSEISPTIKYKRRTLRINLHQLMKNYTKATHVVVKIPPNADPVGLQVDIFNPSERTIDVTLPKWWTLSKHVILKETAENVIDYEILFPQLTNMVQCYLFYVEPITCKNQAHHATASLIVPWAYEDVNAYITHHKRDPLYLRLYSAKPQYAANVTVFARLKLDPSCKYSISVKPSYMCMLGQMVRLYFPLLIATTAVVILLILRTQVITIAKEGYCVLFLSAIKMGIRPYSILIIVNLASRILSLKFFTKYLPRPDWQILVEEGSDSFIVLPLIYFCSVGIIWLLGSALLVSVLVCESTAHNLFVRILTKGVPGPKYITDWLITGLHKIPSFIAICLIVITLNTCGGLSLCLGMVFYFLKLTQMSQDYMEEVVISVMKNLFNDWKQFLNGIFFKQTTDAHDKKLETLKEVTMEEEGSDTNSEEMILEAEKTDTNSKAVGDLNESSTEKVELNEDTKEELVEIYRNPSNDLDLLKIESESSVNLFEVSTNNTIFFHFTIFLLWCAITALNFPSVLIWAHNFKYSSKLEPDPSFVPGLTLSICALFLWQFDLPKINKRGYELLGLFLYVISIYCLIYAKFSVYRLTAALTIVFPLIVLHQLFAPTIDDRDSSEISQIHYENTDIGTMKAKWE